MGQSAWLNTSSLTVQCIRGKSQFESDSSRLLPLSDFGKTLSSCRKFIGLYSLDNRNTPNRMLKKAGLLTHPTLARRDAPCPKQGRSDRSHSTLLRGSWDDPNCARPTRAFSSRALREYGDCSSYPTPLFQHPATRHLESAS